MNVEVVTYNENITSADFDGKTAIVIDVLRCTTTMITALMNGAASIRAFAQIEDVFTCADIIGRQDCILGGERKAVKVDGFDVGNSPLEYSSELVRGKTVIMSTTNGTRAINGASSAKVMLIGALINSEAVAQKACELANDVIIVCAGTEHKPSADDLLTAGAIVVKMLNLCECTMNDEAIICRLLYNAWRRGEIEIRETFHCSRLLKMGMTSDVEYCLTEDLTDYVPVKESDEYIK